jgi:hypothetical protein
MTMMTMNAKADVLEQMMNAVAAPRTKSGTVRPAVRIARKKIILPATPAAGTSTSLWRATLAEARDAAAEQVLRWVLVGVAAAGLGAVVFTGLRFVLAWEGLVAWVRAAMV